MATLSSFEDLECWKQAAEFRKQVGLITKRFPAEEKFRLTDQLIRASRSVTANIAEGFGRFHYQENTQFCRQARGSLTECVDHLIVANEEGYISAAELQELRTLAIKSLTILNGYINYLQKAKKGSKTDS